MSIIRGPIVSPRAVTRRVLAGVVLVLTAASSIAQAQTPTSRQFPVYLNVEGEYVRTTMALRLPYRTYAQPARALATAATLDADEQTFLRFVDAVRSNDLKSLAAVLAVPPPGPPNASGVAMEPRTPQQMLAIYRQSFGNFEDLRVEGRVPLDDRVLFIWTAGTSKGRMVRGTIVTTADGRRQALEVTMDQPIETFIVNSLNRLTAEELPGSAPATGSGVHVLPLTKSGVELRFAGSRPETSAPGPKATGPLAVLAERVKAAQAQNTDRFLALHTPKSVLKLKQWFGTMNREALGAHFADHARTRQVRLVMDGGPVLVVFSAPRGSDGTSSIRDVRYDYLVRDAGGFRIANMLYASFFDDVLKGTPAVAAFLEQGSPGK